ncbi:MAG: DNA mismatch repair endonuclease MutH [bacterium]
MLTANPAPPKSEDELLDRAHSMAGHTLGEVAEVLNEDAPLDLRRNKGWVGQIIERYLGASAGNKPVPDFENLGIELKTLPVDLDGKPFESTYVTTMELSDADDVEWETSNVRLKLQRVLWVPVQGDRAIEVPDRMIGRAALWSPSTTEEAALRADWESHMRAVREGFVQNIRGTDGDFLQVRPKAANSDTKTWGVDEFGGAILTNPRGFYLRALFTEYVLRSQLAATRRAIDAYNDD